ncbi:hypothetical protein ABFX02_11G095400 [Erythranthe guttata]
MMLVNNTADYFYGHSRKDEGLRLFFIVRNFLIILDKVCKEVKNSPCKQSVVSKKEDTVAAVCPPDTRQSSTVTDHRHLLFPAIVDRRMDNSKMLQKYRVICSYPRLLFVLCLAIQFSSMGMGETNVSIVWRKV